jgi:DNA polymerase-4
VEPHRERKSLSTERTYLQNLSTLAACEAKLPELHAELVADLAKSAEKAGGPKPIHKVFLKVKFADFTRTTVERLGSEPLLSDYLELLAVAFRRKEDKGVRLMGVGVRFETEPTQEQLSLAL